MSFRFSVIACLISAIALNGCFNDSSESAKGSARKRFLMNVSYDPTRQLYDEYNAAFKSYWKEKTGETLEISQSHGGSGKQSRSIADGNNADVVTLALAYDIDSISRAIPELIPENWQSLLPNNSCPYTSTIVFLVREGNPMQIKDWDDLLKPNVKIITPDPQTSGGARWNYLAAWGYKLKKELGDLSVINDPTQKEKVDAAQKKAFEFVSAIFNNNKVPVWDTGARGATNTFVKNRQGDVLLAWENEAILAKTLKEGGGNFEIITPSISVLAEPAVAVVEGYAIQNANLELAKEYLKYLYSDVGQQIIASHHYRPSNPEMLKKLIDDPNVPFSHMELFTIDEVFGGWKKAQAEHFDRGGSFERIK